jgi:hypothetical protein
VPVREIRFGIIRKTWGAIEKNVKTRVNMGELFLEKIATGYQLEPDYSCDVTYIYSNQKWKKPIFSLSIIEKWLSPHFPIQKRGTPTVKRMIR